MMLFVRRKVGHPHHQPGDDGRDHVDGGVQRLGNQRETADGNTDHEFGRGHAGAGKNRDRRDPGFDSVIGRTHGRGFSSPSLIIKAPINCAIATQSQQRLLRIIPTLKSSSRYSVTTILPRWRLASMCSKALPISSNANTLSIGSCSLRDSTAGQISLRTSSKISRISSIERVRKVTPIYWIRRAACRSKLKSAWVPPSLPTLTMRPLILVAARFWLATLPET